MKVAPTNPGKRAPIHHSLSQHQDELLDEALAETFPASDPISIESILPVKKLPRKILTLKKEKESGPMQ